jgi:hypothetical protein
MVGRVYVRVPDRPFVAEPVRASDVFLGGNRGWKKVYAIAVGISAEATTTVVICERWVPSMLGLSLGVRR